MERKSKLFTHGAHAFLTSAFVILLMLAVVGYFGSRLFYRWRRPWLALRLDRFHRATWRYSRCRRSVPSGMLNYPPASHIIAASIGLLLGSTLQAIFLTAAIYTFGIYVVLGLLMQRGRQKGVRSGGVSIDRADIGRKCHASAFRQRNHSKFLLCPAGWRFHHAGRIRTSDCMDAKIALHLAIVGHCGGPSGGDLLCPVGCAVSSCASPFPNAPSLALSRSELQDTGCVRPVVARRGSAAPFLHEHGTK